MHCNGVDYRDRWRFDENGNRKLTLRRIGVLVRRLPPNSAVAVALGGSGWTLGDYLTASIWQAFTGQPHPAVPVTDKSEDPIRKAKFADAQERAKERQRKIDAKEIV